MMQSLMVMIVGGIEVIPGGAVAHRTSTYPATIGEGTRALLPKRTPVTTERPDLPRAGRLRSSDIHGGNVPWWS